MKEIRGKLREVDQADSKDLCIYKVPNKLRKVKEDAYNPRAVSIGPFHRKNPDLVAGMREHKWRYMLSFLQQTEDPKDSRKCLEECTNAIYDKDGEVRRCYAEKIKQDKDELMEIMLLDGCFILELFLRYIDQEYLKHKQLEDGADPIVKSAWMIAALRHDLALLENQIPFFILEKLYDIIKARLRIDIKSRAPNSVAILALKFFQPLSLKPIQEDQLGGTEFKHLLDLLHKFYFFPSKADDVRVNMESVSENGHRSAVPQTCSCLLFSKFKFTIEKQKPKSINKWGFNHCASELMESGIEFQTNQQTEDHHLLNIRFTTNGVIKIPQLSIHQTTSSLFRNLIAYEQCSLGSTHNVTSYAFLMMSLISSSHDSKLLQKKGIIQHKRIGDKEYLVQFQSILEEVFGRDDFCFGPLCDSVTEYCKSWCNLRKLQVFLRVRFLRDIKLLYSTYFSSTWSFISFLAAVALLILTSLQTYYTINPSS